MSRATNSERSPLLRIQSRQSDAPSLAVTSDLAPSTFQISAVCFALVAAQQVAALLALLATPGLNQAALCRRLYGYGNEIADPATDERCLQNPALQKQLMRLGSIETTLAAVMAVVAPIPVAIAADRFGRRPFLVLPLAGGLLNIGSRMFIYKFPQIFPTQLIWLSALFEHLTGSGATFFAIIYTILTDVTSSAQRSTSFFHLMAVNILAVQVAVKLASLLTDKFGPWPVLLAALVTYLFGILCAFCVPETIHLGKTIGNEEAVEEESAAQNNRQRILGAIPAAYRQTTETMAALFCHNRRPAVLLLTLFGVGLSIQPMTFLPLYINYRYKIPLDKAGSLFTSQSISYFLLNALLLPLAAHALLSFNFSALRKDATFARWGLVAASLALFGIGIAPNYTFLLTAVVFYTLVAAYSGGVRGLLSQLMGEDHMAAMFATSGVLGAIGNWLSEPIFSALFRSGVNNGGKWSGLSYLVLGCIYAVIAAVVFAVTTGTAEQEADYDEED